MDEEQPRSLRSQLLTGLAKLLGVLILYVASSGPAICLQVRWEKARVVGNKLYAPLVWALEGTPLDLVWTDYLNFWLQHGPPLPDEANLETPPATP